MTWHRETTGWFTHHDEIPWYEAPLPTGVKEVLYRLFHVCRPHSVGVHGWDVCQRCACGSARFGATDPHMHPWTPEGPFPFRPLMDSGWWDRNTRYLGTAMFYQPTIRPASEGERP